MAVHAVRTKKFFLKRTTFDTFLRKVDSILMFFQEKLASLVSVGEPFSEKLEGE